MDKNYYFIEASTEKDIIGFNSYVDSLNMAIKNESRFIGLISEFGTGKSSLIKMLKNTKSKDNQIDVKTINLWNCEESKNRNSKLDIHQIFLHQLIDELDIGLKEYYKKKINKKYRVFDLKLGYENKIYIFFLMFFYLVSILEKMEFIQLFCNPIYKYIYYFLIALLTLICIALYKPLLSFNKESSNNYIDENDTKDLYSNIINKYFSKRKNKNKKLIICLEELDRFSDYTVVIKHIKEFYKFYKLNPKNVTFIVAIKSANSLARLSNSNDKIDVTNKIKSAYEKVFDFILNMNTVNIQDYDCILLDLLEEKKNDLPDKVNFPNINKLDAWRYLYLGKNITIRDIKHRYNFAVSLYLSVLESGIENANFKICLFISYLEDEYNSLYCKLINNSNNIKDLLLHYAKNKNLDEFKVNNEKFLDNNEKNIVIDGILKKYINVDYIYYFFKFPKNKKAYTIHELNLYNAIFFNENNSNLAESIEKLTDSEIRNITKKRVDDDILPDVIFNYKRLIRIEYDYERNCFMNTLSLKYDLISNYGMFESLVEKIRLLDKVYYKRIFEGYFSAKKENITNLQPEEKKQLRQRLTKLFGKDSIYFNFMFDENNNIINSNEIKSINDLKVISELTNSKIDQDYISSIKEIIKSEKYKSNILDLLGKLSDNSTVSNNMFYEVFYSIDFTKYSLLDSDIKKIFKFSMLKLELSTCDKYKKFLNHLNKYNEFLDDEYVKLLDYNQPDMIKDYINIIEKYNFISEKGLDLIDKCETKYSLSDNILISMFKKKYYKTYVISRMLNKGIFEYEKEKSEELDIYYIDYFINEKEWNHKINNEMISFLYKNIKFTDLSQKQLKVFVECEQNNDIIDVILSNNDKTFVDDYIKKIKRFKKSDRKEIFEKISKYHKKYKLSVKSKANMKLLAGNNQYEKNLFDDRRR